MRKHQQEIAAHLIAKHPTAICVSASKYSDFRLSSIRLTSNICSGDRIRTGDLPIMSRMLSPTELRRLDYRALCGNRTHHLFLTMEVLYRMS